MLKGGCSLSTRISKNHDKENTFGATNEREIWRIRFIDYTGNILNKYHGNNNHGNNIIT